MVDAISLGQKLEGFREQLLESQRDVSVSTGIPETDIAAFERGAKLPSGDELLILADHFKCDDYKYFLSNDRVAPYEKTAPLFRKHGDQLTRYDRRAIQEFLVLCETEAFLEGELSMPRPTLINPRTDGSHYKTHGYQVARQLRDVLGYPELGVPRDPFHDFRKLGIHIFRRKLENSGISGVFVNHPTAGRCVLVNYDEDPFRQRFTLAHEVAHALLDADLDSSLSFYQEAKDKSEWRANAFASGFLVPDRIVEQIASTALDAATVRKACALLKVNPEPLAIALKERGNISADVFERIRAVRLPRREKVDSELDAGLPRNSSERLRNVLDRGLTRPYIRLCFEAHSRGIISLGRLSEVLLCSGAEARDLMTSFGEVARHGN
jgi:Zn-dependent peptidase ImmA (M78 family)/transcriptional regulator with XRE-family HTH domain